MRPDPIKEMADAVDRLTKRHGRLNMELDWLTVCTVIAQLELSLGHPQQPPVAGAITRSFIDGLYNLVGKEEPRLVELLRGK